MNRLILSTILAVLTLTGCKTTEANYRAAYETAKERADTGGLDSTVYARIRQEARPGTVKVGNDTMPLVTQHVKPTPVDGETDNGVTGLSRYNIVVAQFKQIFNAKSMVRRLKENGYPDAMIVETREPLYYVVASTHNDAASALRGLETIKAQPPLTLRDPFPWVLQPASFAR